MIPTDSLSLPVATPGPSTAIGGRDSTHSEADTPTKHNGRKRTRNVNKWKKSVRKQLRNTGKEYVSTTGKTVAAKLLQPYDHTCKYHCNKHFPGEVRQLIHKKFWNYSSWDLQTRFLCSCVSSKPPKRPKKGARNHRKYSHAIILNGHRVCKEFFLKTLAISNTRFSRVVKSRAESQSFSPTDQRGKHPPGRKTTDVVMQKIKDHIKSFPAYVSHYSRHKNLRRKYLSPELSVAKMYEMYVEKCKEDNEQPAKIWIYRETFNKEFNLSFYHPQTDTCSKCDMMQAAIKATVNADEKKQLENKKELHLRSAEAAREAKKKDISQCREDNTRTVFTFDLQKTLATPSLTTNVVYYKRQYWTYNLGMHNCLTGEAQMYMWGESVASRGSEEVGSCILKYVKTLPDTITHVTAYSDSCGGQNRNNKIAKFWMFIVSNTNVHTVDHKFMVPGHSFLENDADFGLIEKRNRKATHIYIPDDWMELVGQSCKSKFHVVPMQQEDFKSKKNMDPLCIVRKVDSDGNDVKWLQIRWMRFEKSLPLVMQFKETMNEDIPFSKLDFTRMQAGRKPKIPDSLSQLRDEPITLKPAKVKDLLDLLQFIPPIHHHFYRSLKLDLPAQTVNARGRPRGRGRARVRGGRSGGGGRMLVCRNGIRGNPGRGRGRTANKSNRVPENNTSSDELSSDEDVHPDILQSDFESDTDDAV